MRKRHTKKDAEGVWTDCCKEVFTCCYHSVLNYKEFHHHVRLK